jgi:nucleoside-diphosphate-sugar epimerase
MSQRILVIGAELPVGRRVLSALEASDWASPIAVDLRALTDASALLADAEGVACCLGGAPRAIENAAGRLYAALERGPRVPRVVHLGSMTVYGSVSGRVDEAHALKADLGAYSRAQLRSETIARSVPGTVVLRPGAEYGPGCGPWSERIARLLRARRLGDLGARGDGYANLLFIDDLVAAVLIALREPGIEGKVFNLGLPEPPTWNDYLIAYGEALGAVPVRRIGTRRLELESRLLAPALRLAEAGTQRLLPRLGWPAPAITPSLLRVCSQEIRLDVRRAEDSLGLRWTPWLEGVERAARDAGYRGD